ncbi:MAG: response regulator, partial [Rhodocyclaceae bacterium]
INLIGNAIKFTDRGDISVGVGPVLDAANPDEILFSVADTGIGIPIDKQAIVFEAFSQADASTTRRFGGTGLGLPISRRIVEGMGGRMWVESREGAGSTFHFSVVLPRATVAEKEIPLLPAKEVVGADRVRPLDILLAEDNVVNQKLAVAMLARLGHTATVVNDGVEAVALVQQRRFDAILMDVQMPQMSGIDATRAIRAYEASRGIRTPIIAMTANAFAEDRERCIEAGMDDYLSKPVHRDLLATALARISGRSATAPAAANPSTPVDPAAQDVRQFEREATLKSLAGDAELLAELAAVFVTTCSDQLQTLRRAATLGDWPAVAQVAHSVKGGATVFGAKHCIEAAQQVERLARAGDPASDLAVKKLAAVASQLVDELRHEMESRVPETP